MVYFDGHERTDVVACRDVFFFKQKWWSCTVNGNTPELSAGEKPLIRVVHDECTYYANSSQPFFLGDNLTNVLR